MKSFLTSVFFIPLLFLFGSLAASETQTQDLIAKLNEYMNVVVGDRSFNGSVIVTKERKTLLAKGYGFANVEHQVPNTPKTRFRIASITKQFTAMAIMILQEQGTLSVDDLISKHIPNLPKAWNKITIHHLLTHTSGLMQQPWELPEFRETLIIPASLDEIIARYKDKPLLFCPGEGFNYSGIGYFILTQIIEKVSGQTYDDFLHREIFEPLGMNDTGADQHSLILPHRASGYIGKGSNLVNAPPIHMSNLTGSGNLYSTVEDLVRWDQALIGHKLLSEASYRKMYTPEKVQYSWGYGYGWWIQKRFGRTEISHWGLLPGFRAHILRFPEERVCIVALSNIMPSLADKIANNLAAIVFGESYELPQKLISNEVDTKIFNDYVGQYEIEPGLILTVTIEEEYRLMTQMTRQPKYEILPKSETEFFVLAFDAHLSFKRDKSGVVTHVIIYQSGDDMLAKKIK